MNVSKHKKAVLPLCLLLLITIACLFVPSPKAASSNSFDAADTAWMLTATALVLIMTPGLAFFYGGMVNKKNVISTMLQSFVSMAIISVLWVVLGFSLAFGESFHGIVGNPFTYFFMNGVLSGKAWPSAPTIPLVLF